MRLIAMGVLLTVSALCCAADGGAGGAANGNSGTARREEMVTTQIEARGIDHSCVLDAMRRVPRERFVPAPLEHDAYRDGPLSIGRGQTISQPYIVALMTALIEPQPTMRVLEIGTGSGYQAAVLAECVADVYTIEIIPELGRQAAERLESLSYTNIHPRVGDGYDGWPEEAPFDGIVVTAAPSEIPQPLLDQLAVGGRLVIPVGLGSQDLVVVTRTEEGYVKRVETPVRFVPMTGKAEQ
ncbi:MAG: protein-L-isoaspartate(D-aspartate) O-methyltransferase [Acidobacteriota bacterium]